VYVAGVSKARGWLTLPVRDVHVFSAKLILYNQLSIITSPCVRDEDIELVCARYCGKYRE
jgi:hypothetical protein